MWARLGLVMMTPSHMTSLASGLHLWQGLRAICSQGHSFSTVAAASITEQMIGYALQQGKAHQYDTAVDVLRSGMNMQPGGKGTDAARLLLAQASLEWDRGTWSAALTCIDQLQEALVGASSSGPSVTDPDLLRLAAGRLAVSIHLLQGHDEQARASCQSHISTNNITPNARLASLSLELSTLHALCDIPAAETAAQALSKAVQADSGGAGQGEGQGEGAWARVAALTALGDWRSGGGSRHEEVTGLYSSAVQESQRHTPPAHSELSILHGELGAAAALGLSQVPVRAELWDEAEDELGRALTVAEAVSGEQHPRIAPALLLLGSVYARSARVTFAEGLDRQVATLLKVDLAKENLLRLPPSSHHSITAMLAWRSHQLLMALPKRGQEAAAWERAAHTAWSASGPLKDLGSIESFLGESTMLTGKGDKGKGLLLSLVSRRALPLIGGHGR